MLNLNMNILVVDDFEVMRFNMKRILKALHFKKIEEASDGQDAWEKIEAASKTANPIDLVFLDWNMPRMNGLELLIKCRENPNFAKLKIIITTAEREQKSVITAMSKGADDYILKPYSPDTVQKKLFNQFKTAV